MHGQVHTNIDPHVLLSFLAGEAATAASTASQLRERARQEEQRLLQAACAALRAKHVIRVCSVHDHPHVCEAIQRLIGNAAAIRQAVDLSGECHVEAPSGTPLCMLFPGAWSLHQRCCLRHACCCCCAAESTGRVMIEEHRSSTLQALTNYHACNGQ